MDLWIRSQNKRALYCVRQLRINGLDIMCLGGELLGTYKTEERALEVLNDIQNIVNAKTIIKFKQFVPHEQVKRVVEAIDKNSIIELPSYEIKKLAGVIVYEMPSE